MNKRIWKLAALCLALCLALTGCNLIAIDPILQIAEDRAALEDTYQTVLAEYDGGNITVADIIYDFNLQWYMYYQVYSSSGMEMPDGTEESIEESCVYLALNRVALQKQAQERGIALSDTEIAELEETVRSTYESTLETYKAEMNGETDEVRTAQAEYEMYATGQDYEAQLAYQTAEAIAEKMREQMDAEITEVSDETLQQVYDTHVSDDEYYYADAPGDFETAMTGDTLVTWMPEGYRTVKHILLIPDAEVLDPYVEKKNELDDLEAQLETLNGELEAATDDDATDAADETAADAASIQEQIDQTQADISAAEAELAPLAEACMANVQDRLDEIQARLDAGEDFQTLIDEYGEDPGMQNEPTASRGYYVSAESTSWDTAFRDAAMLLENVGDISEPVLGMSGVHIIRYESDVTPGAVPLEEVRDELYEEALTTQREENYADQCSAWIEELNPVYHYDAWSLEG